MSNRALRWILWSALAMLISSPFILAFLGIGGFILPLAASEVQEDPRAHLEVGFWLLVWLADLFVIAGIWIACLMPARPGRSVLSMLAAVWSAGIALVGGAFLILKDIGGIASSLLV